VGGNANGTDSAERNDIDKINEEESQEAARILVERATFSGIERKVGIAYLCMCR
jgi:hypothetical protein